MKYRFLHLIWLIPGWLLFLTAQQLFVYQGAVDTYENGASYIAEVTDFDIKQIAAQSNGYVDLRFEADGNVIERRLTLTVQMAQQLLESPTVVLRYKADSFQPVVLFPTYEIQKRTSLFNAGVAFLGFVAMVIASVVVSKYTERKASEDSDSDKFEIERVDN